MEEENSKYPDLKKQIHFEFAAFADEQQLEQLVDIVLRQNEHEQHYGKWHDRCKNNPREQAFFEQWMKENIPLRGINFGNGILQDIFCERDITNQSKIHYKEIINERDRMIVATVIQWLGTNCGMSFLRQALSRFGEKITTIDKSGGNF